MTSMGAGTREVLSRMKKGDKESFDRFFEGHSARVLVYINYNMGRRLRRKMDPADILQELYLRLLRDFESFCERAEKRGVHRVLIRMADHEITEAYRYYFKTEKRDARREVTAPFVQAEDTGAVVPLQWVPAEGTSVSARIVRNEEYQRVMAMLSKLSPIEQYVTVARVVEGVSAQEIAERLGKSRGAVQMLIARTRDKLRKRFEEDT
jgi:RNA polymerase sigma-70 factor (ECF subfamily)